MSDQKQVIALVGLPGSGKTTLRNEIFNKSTVVVSRDDIREELFGYPYKHTHTKEKEVTRVKEERIDEFFESDMKTLIIDETHCNQKGRNATLRAIGDNECDFRWEVLELSFDPDRCHKNNTKRERSVPYEVIESMFYGFIDFIRSEDDLCPDWLPSFKDEENVTEHSYEIIVDIDGTIAERVSRGPFEWGKVGEDIPKTNVIDVIASVCEKKRLHVVLFSGRDGCCYPETAEWIDRHLTHELDTIPALFMREAGDMRKDYVVKMELLKKHCFAYGTKPRMIFDDRKQVVRYWRALGFDVFQVADGLF